MSASLVPIEDYSCDVAALGDEELRVGVGKWVRRRAAVAGSPEFAMFEERLKREWAIETGLIERLYTFDLGAVEQMVRHGVHCWRIHGDKQYSCQATALIGDQDETLDGVIAFAECHRPLSASYIKELHSLVTRNQPYAEGRDQFGRRFNVSLLRGEYKRHPNNPTRPDGEIHWYCPPEHVAAQMDQLLAWHAAHADAPPEVEAAWLHHRFVQIHPFQDGNGRLARALATLVFVRAGLMPPVVRNNERDAYIGTLDAANDGDLGPLVRFFAGVQVRQIRAALALVGDGGEL